ncbi:MAG TPA: Uma2 family endonuclease [Solirubrobacteraceae bacterium]|nr:Uma2 family endonuclease [Solirubrobacteraceae bacterium]
MATEAAHDIPTDSPLPLYRLDVGTYDRMVAAGALAGVDVELRDGLLIDRRKHGEPAIHRLDTATYNRMVATGALEGEPVELLDGLLVEMSPQGPAHDAVVTRLVRHLATARAWLGVQGPLEIRPGSEPEPDLKLTDEEPSFDHLSRTALLVVEVAVTSHAKDRETKAETYAAAGIPTYWLVDVPGRAVEVRSDPGPQGYRRCEVYRAGEHVPSPAEGVSDLDVASLFED